MTVQVLHGLSDKSLRDEGPAGELRMSEVEAGIEHRDFDSVAAETARRHAARDQAPGGAEHLRRNISSPRRLRPRPDPCKSSRRLGARLSCSRRIDSGRKHEVFGIDGVDGAVFCNGGVGRHTACGGGIAAQQRDADFREHESLGIGSVIPTSPPGLEVTRVSRCASCLLRLQRFIPSFRRTFLERDQDASGFVGIGASFERGEQKFVCARGYTMFRFVSRGGFFPFAICSLLWFAIRLCVRRGFEWSYADQST